MNLQPVPNRLALPEVLPTDEAAAAINRQPQTLRKWACLENGPIRPIRINGRLAWRVSDLQKLLDGESLSAAPQPSTPVKTPTAPAKLKQSRPAKAKTADSADPDEAHLGRFEKLHAVDQARKARKANSTETA
ncbi:UNVERIFIED_ORG: hypothetical protein ABIC62_002440 [Burkholderia sp. 1595]|uniref:Helix-turn-helix domain-containing protein n=1 Tax=Paraburkholderia terricola TaxID=169427 RepID=A0ABU1LSK7_9BURK|nr:hypothetical protein [Paraburkholderia terricola]